MKTSSIIAAVALASFSTGNAALINVNFNGGGDTPAESSLSGPAGGLSTTWNSVSTVSTGALNDSTGAPTTVSVSTNYSNVNLGNQTAGTLPIFRSFVNIFDRPNNNTMTISGLASGGLYNIWILSYRDIETGATTERSVGTWATTNTTTSASSQIVNSQTSSPDGESFLEGYNYLLFSNVEATAGGDIFFTAQGQGFGSPQDGDSRRLHLNGLQISAVPEPGSVVLIGLGALLGLRRRR